MNRAQQRAIWSSGWDKYNSRLWSKEEIINRIRRMAHEGLRIYLAAVAGREEWHLIRAAAYYFGSWRAAVKAAGFNYDVVRADKKWSHKKVLNAIWNLRGEGKAITSAAAQISEPALFAAACRKRLFGSWEKAVEACGLDYGRIKRYQQWDESGLKKAVADMEEAGVALNAKNVRANYPLVYFAACHRYVSWGKALKAFGYDPRSVALRRKRSKDEILEEIRQLRRKGVHLSDNNVRKVAPPLYAAACKAFNGWVSARDAACNGSPKRWQRMLLGF